MLHDFLDSHRAELRGECTAAAASRFTPTVAPAGHGVPIFLDQLIAVLRHEHKSTALKSRVDRAGAVRLPGESTSQADTAEIAVTARQHGLALARHGATLEQVVHEYAGLCQAITELAGESVTPIALGEFKTLNRCVADAIAGAVTEFSYQRDALLAQKNSQGSDDRARVLLQSFQSHVDTATLAIEAITAGGVGMKGATATILGISLASMRTLIERSLAQTKESARASAQR